MDKIVANSDIVVKNYLSDDDVKRLKEVYELSKAGKNKLYSLEEMKKMVKEGKTIFFSTHILDVAEKLCDHVAIIKAGKIVKTGKMKDIKGDSSLEQVFLELGENK